MEVFNELISRVSSGETFDINFDTKSIRVGKKYLIKDGQYDVDYLGWATVDRNTVMQTIERLYQNYKFPETLIN